MNQLCIYSPDRHALQGFFYDLIQKPQDVELPHPFQGKPSWIVHEDHERYFLWEEKKRDESDFLEYQDMGTLVKDYLGQPLLIEKQQLVKDWNLEHLLNQGMAFLSTGERRKCFLLKSMEVIEGWLLLCNPWEGLDQGTRDSILEDMEIWKTPYVLLTQRLEDIPQKVERLFMPMKEPGKNWILKEINTSKAKELEKASLINTSGQSTILNLPPSPMGEREYMQGEELIRLNRVNLAYYGKPVLKEVSWTIRQGDFWQLSGPNGSGKSSLLSLINGDNPRAFGQEIYLFGKRKGSGESLWDIRSRMGIYDQAMERLLPERMTVEELLLSGFYDSLGLYQKSNDFHRRLVKDWISLSPLPKDGQCQFFRLYPEEQRIALILRALVKHPPLVLLDEPLLGLDSQAARLVSQWIHSLAEASHSAVVLISHRVEKDLTASNLLKLIPGPEGSTAEEVLKN